MPENKKRKKIIRRPKRLKHISFRAVAPNMVTILALSAGATSIRFALEDRWEFAVIAIVIAAFLDGLDGILARLLKSTSKFGAELDSLSDVISFGVAPATLLYLWALKDLGGLGWVIALSFIVCCALRLARYNSKLEDDDEPWRGAGFLTGLPAPVGAGLALLPIMLAFEFGSSLITKPETVGFYAALLCLGMVSKLPTYSLKTLIIRKDYMVHALLLVALFAAAATAYGWMTLIAFGVIYILSLPIGVFRFYKLSKSGL